MFARDRVRAARVLAGLTLDELAVKLGVKRVNPVRWENTRDLPARQVKPLSLATGFPEAWLKCDDLEGLITARPVLPGVKLARNVQERIRGQLLTMLPEMCPKAKRVTVVSSVGTTFVFRNDDGRHRYCLVVFVREPLADQLQELRGDVIEADASVWWDAYLQPNYQYLRTILELAECLEWAAVVPEGEPDEQPTTVSARMEVRAPAAESAAEAINEIKGLVKALRKKGLAVAVSIDEVSGHLVALDGAPAGYVYRPLRSRAGGGDTGR